MTDIELAKKILKEEGCTLVVVKERKVLFSSKEKGIRPLYEVTCTIKDQLKGASIADRVIGKAAAILCVHLEIKYLHTRLISQDAMKVLKKSEIIFYYEEACPYIQNRNKNGRCPMEELSQAVEDPICLLKDIGEFMKKSQS
ncbi:DUF1893 domain-containing protein [Inediibacterium massiliense]|uniref:DUF1893 domain-containing protein n=1 Tax=Inediibacterium massiliense TaxID=1658111 RepID=UPI0006B587A5|nr:DUF1893 domain-containing protein [Inediibacterium massiliense]